MKHTQKRIISLVLSVLMLLSLLPAGMLAVAQDAMNADNTIYVDQATGLDTNVGTEAAPVQTIEKAVELLEAGDKATDGYVYLMGDYTAVYDASSTVAMLPDHTRHIIITGDADEKPTWKFLFAPKAITSRPERHFGAAVNLDNNGPVTLDCVNVNFSIDPDNPLKLATAHEATLSDAYGELAGKKFKFSVGDPLYKVYNNFVVDPADENYVLDNTDRALYPDIYPVRIDSLRPAFTAPFYQTANASVTVDKTVDQTRTTSIIPTSGNNHSQNILYHYSYSTASLTIDGGTWDILNCSDYLASKVFYDDVVWTIGANATVSRLYSPDKNIPATTKVTYVIEKANYTYSYPFNAGTAMVCDYTLVAKAAGLKLSGDGLASLPATGSYNLVIDQPKTTGNANANVLKPGFYSLQFTNIESDFSIDLSTLPEVGYEVLRIAEGDVLTLSGETAREITLDIALAGENDSFVVLKGVSEAVFNAITLDEDDEAVGSLSRADDGTVTYTLDRANYTFNKGDTNESISLPKDIDIAVTKTFTVPEIDTTVLADGRSFKGWQDEEGNFYKAGETVTVEEASDVTLTALWGLKLSFVTGYEEAATPVVREPLYFTEGERIALPSDLRADDTDGDGVSTLKIVTDGGKDYVFYGWKIDGEFYQAGHTLTTADRPITATAVYVPAIYVKPTYAGGDSDGTKEKPFTTILNAQIAMKKLFGETAEEDVPAGSIVMMENTVWSWSFAETIGGEPNPAYVGGEQSEDGNIYYYSSNSTEPLKGQAVMADLGRQVLYTALSNDISVLFYQYEGLYFYSMGDFLMDNLTYFVRCYHGTPRFYLYSANDTLYVGPTVKTEAKVVSSTPSANNAGMEFGHTDLVTTYDDGGKGYYSKFLFDMSYADATVYLLSGTHIGLYMMYNNAGIQTAYIGAPGLAGPTMSYVAPGNTNTTVAGVWNYHQYSGNIGQLRFGNLSSYNYLFGSTWNMYFYGNVSTTLNDNNNGFSGYKGAAASNQIDVNLYFVDATASITTKHTENYRGFEAPTANGQWAADQYYGTFTSSNKTYYGYSDASPAGVASINLQNSNVNFTNPIYVKSSDTVAYKQDENSSYTGSIYATKDVFVEDAEIEYKLNPVTVTETLSAMGNEGTAYYADFDGEKWVEAYKFSYDSGFDSVADLEDMYAIKGDRLVLTNELRGEVVTDGGKELTFFGWNIGGKFYDAGDGFVMSSSDVTATAVWVPAVFVDGTSGNDETGNGTKANPYKSVSTAYTALKNLLSASDAAGGAVYLLSGATLAPANGTDFYIANNPTNNTHTLVDAGKPVLFTAASNDIELTIQNDTSQNIGFFGSVLFDHLAIAFTYTDNTYSRLIPMKNIYFGSEFGYFKQKDSKISAPYLDSLYHTSFKADYKLYNGKFGLLYLGSSNAATQNVHTEVNLYIGTGDALSNPSVDYISPISKTYSTTIKAEFRSGSVMYMSLGAIGVGTGTQPNGDLIYIIHNGVKIDNLYDSYNGSIPTSATYGANLTRTIVFDGYVGNIPFTHVANNSGTAVNGLDSISFINGASVNFTKTDVAMVAGANGVGSVYVEEGSAYSGKAIVGTYLDGSAQVNGSAYTVTKGKLNSWNGTEWTTDVYGLGLGAQIRTQAPYGIRFGFIGSIASLEAMLGQAVEEKGILLIPTALLNETLSLNTENVLKVEAKVAYALNQPNVFTAMLVDDYVNSNQAWLDTWKDVEFTACAYFKLADGSVIYSDTIARSISGVTADILG